MNKRYAQDEIDKITKAIDKLCSLVYGKDLEDASTICGLGQEKPSIRAPLDASDMEFMKSGMDRMKAELLTAKSDRDRYLALIKDHETCAMNMTEKILQLELDLAAAKAANRALINRNSKLEELPWPAQNP